MEALLARGIQILIALGGAYALTLWFALIVWTFQDIQARSRSVVAQIFSTLVVMIFFLPGLLVYLVLRPRYTLDDAFQRSLEEEYLMQDLEELPLCPGCQHYIEDEWVFCPNCRTELRDDCVSCGRLIDLQWEICPYCGAEQDFEDVTPVITPVTQPIREPVRHVFAQPVRPPLTQVEIREIEASDKAQRTRQIIPATVRVDLRSRSISTEEIAALSEALFAPPLHQLGPPKRVTLSGNGRSGEPVEPGTLDAEFATVPERDGSEVVNAEASEGEQTESVAATEASAQESEAAKSEKPRRTPRKRRAKAKKDSDAEGESSS